MKKWLFAAMLVWITALALLPTVALADYNIWVQGTQVTDANKDNVLSGGVNDGKVKYDPGTNTLTLNGATINVLGLQGTIYFDNCGIYANQDIKIALIGTNTMEVTGSYGHGICAVSGSTFNKDVTVSGGGSLNVTTENEALRAHDITFTADHGTFTAVTNSNHAIQAQNMLTISGGTVTVTGQIGAIEGSIRFSGDYATAANRRVMVGSASGTTSEWTGDNLNDPINSYKYVSITPIVSAAASDVTVTGTTGTAIPEQALTLTLTSACFNGLAANRDVSDWFTNRPTNLSAKIQTEVAAGAKTATVILYGTPTTVSAEAMAITIPAASLTSGANVTATANANAKWNVAAPSAPTFSAQPANQSVTEGQPATFTVTVAGNPAPGLQWQVFTRSGTGWENIPGATGASYPIAVTSLSQDGNQFRCLASNTVASDVASGAATLTVTSAPAPSESEDDEEPSTIAITEQSEDAYVAAGNRATFSVSAVGEGLKYQWYINRNDGKGWQVLSGATSAVYTTSPVRLRDDGYRYMCWISDSNNTYRESQTVTLFVLEAGALPQTGDSAMPGLWMALLLLGGAGFIVMMLRKRQGRQ